ncbi:Iron-sulfur cluster assembly 1-like, mitochondrial [Cricetulus griseus]|uniref:Iron-sulfur cluster assembly 1-like, mitochondrial n=1 Tax=Cricetulus griseus TaxID=10029 RepID=G3H1B0_CRIGR|nr:Iron-sulfur cluster assembly 1-like, mitochondrial [Cricetulus griseus]ERE84679.1 putative iron-sulfur cluster assembly 1 like protein [Cricetulus griseus]
MSLVCATVRTNDKKKLQPMWAVLTLTPSAVNKIKQLLKDKPEHVGLKVGVRTWGCNGLSYTLGVRQKEILMKKLFKMESECSSKRKHS